MMPNYGYIMESEEEAIRLDIKTDPEAVKKQALWAGIKPGLRIADLGCGSGKTSFYLNQLAQLGGETIGVDLSKQRIRFAQKKYSAEGLSFQCLDIRQSLEALGAFDFIWIRFVLEYYSSTSVDIIQNVSKILKPGGILCLIDLDYNCLSHYGIPSRIDNAIFRITNNLEKVSDFDPYAGRKLYSYLYDLGYHEIDVQLTAHHLIFGELKETDAFNWTKKVEIAAKNSGYKFEEYSQGYKGFMVEFKESFENPRRFTYTPLIMCKGLKPLS